MRRKTNEKRFTMEDNKSNHLHKSKDKYQEDDRKINHFGVKRKKKLNKRILCILIVANYKNQYQAASTV